MKQEDKGLSGVDREIYSLYLLLKSSSLVVDAFFDRISERVLSVEDQVLITPFFLLSGANLKLLEVFREHLSIQHAISWSSLVETLIVSGYKFDQTQAQQIYQEAKEQNLLDDLIRTKSLDIWLPELVQYRDQQAKQKALEALKKRSELLQQVDMYKAQDLDDKELEVLTFLSMVDPTDEIVEAKLNDLKKRRAKVLLESKLEDRFLIPRSKQAHFSQDESESQEKLYHAILERVQDQNSNPDLIYEYAVTLSQMDLFKEALEVLKYIPSLTVTQSWLKLNLLKNTHQYLKALEFLDQLETMDPQDESHELAIQYERAIIYFYLNQKNKALQLLQEMAGLNPDYRDISTLIRQWRSS